MKTRPLLTALALSLCLAVAVAVLGGSPALRRKDKLFFQIDLASTNSGVAQVFFDIGRGFTEQDSLFDGVRGGKRMEHHRFAVPPTTLYALRFDPINFQADVTFSGAAIVDEKGRVVHHFNPADFTAGKHINTLKRHDDTVEMTCVEGGNDPILYVALPPSISARFVFTEWARKASPIAMIAFVVIGGLVLAVSRANGYALESIAKRVHASPLLTLALVSGLGVLLQFHPLFLSNPNAFVPRINPPIGIGLGDYFRTLQPPPPVDPTASAVSSLAWADLLSLLPKTTENAGWAIHLSVVFAWWIYVLGCGLLAWVLTRSLSIASLICGCALFTRVWSTELFPSSPPGIVFAPWIVLAWFGLANAVTGRKIILGCAFVLFASTQLVAAERSLGVLMVLISTNAAGFILVAWSPITRTLSGLRRLPKNGTAIVPVSGVEHGLATPSIKSLQVDKTERAISADKIAPQKPGDYFILGAALTTIGLLCAMAGPALWPFIHSIPRGASGSVGAGMHPVPASIAVTFFESFMLGELPGFGIPPAVNLVVLAGLAWAFARMDELLSKPAFIAFAVVTLPLVFLGSGSLPDALVPGWLKLGSALTLQHSAWSALVLFTLILAIFGFAGLRQLCASKGAGIYIGKASLFFFLPFAVYFGTVQHHTSYTFKTAYLFSIIVGWTVAHLALTRLYSGRGYRSSVILVSFALLLAWWHQSPYIHFFLRDALSAR